MLKVRLLDLAFDQGIGNSTAKYILIIMARRANASGLCWMSQATIAKEAGCSVETVGRAIRWLSDRYYIIEDKDKRNRAGTKTYRFILDKPGDRQSAGLPLSKSDQDHGQNDGQNLYESLIESPGKQFATVDNLSIEPKAVPRSASKRHQAVSFGELSQDLLANQLKKAGQ